MGATPTSKLSSRKLVGCVGLAAALLACATEPEPGTVAPPAPTTAEAERSFLGRTAAQPLPPLAGVTLDGDAVDLGMLSGRRIVLFLFEPGAPEATLAGRALSALLGERTRHNFEVVGVAVGASRVEAQAYAAAQGFGFPIFDDADRRMARSVNMKTRATVLATDADGYVVYAVRRFPGQGAVAVTRLESRLREKLRLPTSPVAAELLARPQAPDFRAAAMPIAGSSEPSEPLTLRSLRGRPVLLIFFLNECPYCQAALRTVKGELAKLPAPGRPAVFGVEVSARTQATTPSLVAEGLDFFPVLRDLDWSLRNAYGVFGEVPVMFFIDAEGGILYRTKPGWDPARDPAIVSAMLAKLVGAPIALPSDTHGYSGNDVCGACHEMEHATWQLTAHASAFDTLVTHGAERDEECVSCHVVGFGTPGGYVLTQGRGHLPADLEDVGCESCHGRGGPHVSPDFVARDNYEPVCVTCHDAKHSLFDYASFHTRVSHVALAALSSEERAELVARRGRPREVLPTAATLVGSQACAGCHPAEFETWAASPHAHAVASLGSRGEDDNPKCLTCHTTGFARPGGFPADGRVDAHPDLARVGCESCHGPGGDHVGPNAVRRGSIVSLTDKCDSCVILQICGTCHDEANDPGFRFDVERKIELQRHGTLELPDARSPDGS